ncbi:MAG: hypothetical protein JO137_05180 [Hyphomicrobiales bacterium]|nr:hypothetical protein [Hyphomicrobiales bacterium]MBV9431198.1 hypothetical protein [Hyphomicrobiales bacterium]
MMEHPARSCCGVLLEIDHRFVSKTAAFQDCGFPTLRLGNRGANSFFGAELGRRAGEAAGKAHYIEATDD